MIDYYNKYLKYKINYLDLKNNEMIGGSEKKILFIMFQGGATNLKNWNEYTESKFLDKLRKLGEIYVYQDKIYNTMHYDKTIPNYKDYDSDIDIDLRYNDLNVHIKMVYQEIKNKYKDVDNYQFIPVGWSAGGYLALYFAQIYFRQCKMCVLLDSALFTKKNINIRLKSFEVGEKEYLIYPITNNRYGELLDKLKLYKNDEWKKILVTSTYIRTLFIKENIEMKFKVPVISFVYISEPEKYEFGDQFNNETKLREIDVLNKKNPKMYKSYILKNSGHCVFNKKRPANFIINTIKKSIVPLEVTHIST